MTIEQLVSLLKCLVIDRRPIEVQDVDGNVLSITGLWIPPDEAEAVQLTTTEV